MIAVLSQKRMRILRAALHELKVRLDGTRRSEYGLDTETVRLINSHGGIDADSIAELARAIEETEAWYALPKPMKLPISDLEDLQGPVLRSLDDDALDHIAAVKIVQLLRGDRYNSEDVGDVRKLIRNRRETP